MKNLTTAFGRTIFLGLLFCVAGATHQALAQTPGSGGPTPGPDTDPATNVPLDGGASLLLAGGIGYGLRRLRRNK